MIQKFRNLTNAAKNLVTKHGAEIGAVAKIAAHALIPGAPIVVGAVESLCDYTADKSQELTDETITKMIEGLGGDVQHLETVFGHLSGQLEGVLSMMAQSAHFGAQPEVLEAMMNSALESQFSELRNELRALTPELETVKRQQMEMLRKQNLQGDVLEQVKASMDAALAYNEPLASEGVVGTQVSPFLGARGRFQCALLSADFKGAKRALDEMKAISPNGNTYRVSEMSLRAVIKDFTGAERIAKTIVGAGADQPRVQRAKQSLTELTQVRGGRMVTRSTTSEQNKCYEVGSKIGDKGWTLTHLLGRGGMGSVWQAKNTRGQEGAVKLMNAELNTDPHFVSRFEAEIDALDRVSHAAVIEILDWGQDRSGAWYFVMPFIIAGSSLRTKLGQNSLNESEVKVLAQTLTSGLVACHKQGVIHRDIKPENIMLKRDGTPVLIDFGIAHQIGQTTGMTKMATVGYAPPEQAAGRTVDHSADLYALGMTLAECLGTQAASGIWRELIAQLTHFLPSARGTAQSLLETLQGDVKKYHVGRHGQDPEGPLSAEEVCRYILSGQDNLRLWWQGASGWLRWGQVSEISEKVEASRQNTPPPLEKKLNKEATPPPFDFNFDDSEGFETEESLAIDPEDSARLALERAEREAQEAFERAQAQAQQAATLRAERERQAQAQAARLARVRQMEAKRQAMELSTRFFKGELSASALNAGLKECMQSGQLSRDDLPEAIRSLLVSAGDAISQRIKGVDFKLNYIPAGDFRMGSDDQFGWGSKDQHQPRHQVKLTKPFYMAQTQVTQAQWKAIMGSDPSHFKGANLPVEQVSWFDCIRFCNALSQADGLELVYRIGSGEKPTVELDLGRNGYRLPTEAEWEYTAKAGTELTYGGSDTVDEVAWYSSNAGGKTHPVAQKKANAWGVFDLSGNVFEWCNDTWNESAYQNRTSVTTDPIEWVGSASPRVHRGGNWGSGAGNCRVASRDGFDADLRGDRLGFRFLRCEL